MAARAARISGIFSASFSAEAPREAPEQESEPGSDLEYQVDITFWEAVRGTVKKLTITRLEACDNCHGTGSVGAPQVCPVCGGTGQVAQTSGRMRFNLPCSRCGGTGRVGTICPVCGGEGRVRRSETIDVRIPAGVQSGSRVRVPGHGNAGTHGAPPGDLYIITEVQPHPYFQRRGDDLYTVVPITVTEAALGAKIEVPTLDGRSQLRVPPGTSSGQKLRLREKGVPSVRQHGKRGDLYVEVAGSGAQACGRACAQPVARARGTRAGEPAPRAIRARDRLSSGASLAGKEEVVTGDGHVHAQPRKKSRAGYMISAVADLYKLHPQTLRLYERVGLLKPSRSEGTRASTPMPTLTGSR